MTKDKILEFTDFMYEDGEVFIPPIMMEGYEESNYKKTVIERYKTLPLSVKAAVFSFGLTSIYGVIEYFRY